MNDVEFGMHMRGLFDISPYRVSISGFVRVRREDLLAMGYWPATALVAAKEVADCICDDKQDAYVHDMRTGKLLHTGKKKSDA